MPTYPAASGASGSETTWQLTAGGGGSSAVSGGSAADGTGATSGLTQRSALREALRQTSKGVKRAVGIPSKAEKAAGAAREASARSSPANSGRAPPPPAPPPMPRSATPPRPTSPKPLPRATPPAKSRSSAAPADSDVSEPRPGLGFSLGKAIVCVVAVVVCRALANAQPQAAEAAPSGGKKKARQGKKGPAPKAGAGFKAPAFWTRKDWACSPKAKPPTLGSVAPKDPDAPGVLQRKDWACSPKAAAPVLSSQQQKKKKGAGSAPPKLWERTDWECSPKLPPPPLASRDGP